MKTHHYHLPTIVILLIGAVLAYPGTATSGSHVENRYRKIGNRAHRATDSRGVNRALLGPPAPAFAPAAMRKHSPNDDNNNNNNGEGEETQGRWKRAYSPWDGEHSEYKTFTSFSVWKPPVYQIDRPYYIPVYGEPGRVQIYFAPQPFNPSIFPSKNKPPYAGPTYLPPTTTTPKTETTMKVENRFDFDDDDDDRPIWDGGNTINNNNNVPTRAPPPPPGASQFPPLVHDVGNSVHLSAQDEETINQIFNDNFDRGTTKAPPAMRRTTTTQRPRTTTAPAPAPGPSNCVWAVVSCCSAATNVYPERCFEQRGCPGPFWGSSPCDTEFAKAAVEAALKYYNQ